MLTEGTLLYIVSLRRQTIQNHFLLLQLQFLPWFLLEHCVLLILPVIALSLGFRFLRFDSITRLIGCKLILFLGDVALAFEAFIDHFVEFEFIAVDAMFDGSVDSGQRIEGFLADWVVEVGGIDVDIIE